MENNFLIIVTYNITQSPFFSFYCFRLFVILNAGLTLDVIGFKFAIICKFILQVS